MEGNRFVVVESKGHCLLCLLKLPPPPPPDRPGGGEDGNCSKTSSLQRICHYLKLDKMRIFKEAVDLIPASLFSIMEGSELKGVLCTGCSQLTGRISDVARELEAIQMRMDSLLWKLIGKIKEVEAEKNGELVEAFKREMLRSPETLLDFGIVGEFRKETLRKAASLIGKNCASLKRVDNVDEIPKAGTGAPAAAADIEDVSVRRDAPPVVTLAGTSDVALDLSISSPPSSQDTSAKSTASKTTLSVWSTGSTGSLHEASNSQSKSISAILAKSPSSVSVSAATLQAIPLPLPLPAFPEQMSFHECKICHRRYGTLLRLLDHFRAVHQGYRYICGKCFVPYSYKSNLLRHWRLNYCLSQAKQRKRIEDPKNTEAQMAEIRNYNKQPQLGGQPSKPAKKQPSQQQQLRPFQETTLLPCRFCPVAYRKQADRLGHEMTCHRGQKFKCRMCPAEFMSSSTKYRHQRTHRNRNQSQAGGIHQPGRESGVPSKSPAFVNVASFINGLDFSQRPLHMEFQETEPSGVTRPTLLHPLSMHQGTSMTSSAGPAASLFGPSPPKINRSTPTSAALQETVYECGYCPTQFRHKRSVYRHHNRQHGMAEAGRSSAGTSSSDPILRQLLSNSNNDSQPAANPEPKHVGTAPGLESLHLPSSSPLSMTQRSTNFECEICHGRFSSSKSMLDHKKTIHFGMRFHCPLCSSTFLERQLLEEHRKEFHKQTVSSGPELEPAYVNPHLWIDTPAPPLNYFPLPTGFPTPPPEFCVASTSSRHLEEDLEFQSETIREQQCQQPMSNGEAVDDPHHSRDASPSISPRSPEDEELLRVMKEILQEITVSLNSPKVGGMMKPTMSSSQSRKPHRSSSSASPSLAPLDRFDSKICTRPGQVNLRPSLFPATVPTAPQPPSATCLFKCNVCPKQFQSLGSLRQHRTVVHDTRALERKYECNLCGKKYIARANLIKHRRSFHLGQGNNGAPAHPNYNNNA